MHNHKLACSFSTLYKTLDKPRAKASFLPGFGDGNLLDDLNLLLLGLDPLRCQRKAKIVDGLYEDVDIFPLRVTSYLVSRLNTMCRCSRCVSSLSE